MHLSPTVMGLVAFWARGDRDRETAVLAHLGQGQSVRSIAMVLGRPKSTVHDWIADFQRTVASASRTARARDA